jgi:hypothetical protein
MILDEEKKQKVIGWIKEGKKLSEIQDLLAKEFGIRMTYMEVRLLIDDLKVQPQELETQEQKAKEEKEKEEKKKQQEEELKKEDKDPEVLSGVKISIDEVAKPGAVLSGKVRFSDGVSGEWYIDQMGRLGLGTSVPGYRPSPQDIEKFQAELEKQLSKFGYF